MADRIELGGTGLALVVLIGAAGAGKSTLAKRLREDGIVDDVVALDACRAAVSGDPADQDATPAAVTLMHHTVRTALRAGRRVLVDATNTGRDHRGVLVDLAREQRAAAVAVLLDTPVSVCVARQATRLGPLPGRRYGRKVPGEVIRAQDADITTGFLDRTCRVRGSRRYTSCATATWSPAGPRWASGCAARGRLRA